MIQFLIFYFLLPETKKRTLEELDLIFEARNPVKESLKAHKLELNANRVVIGHAEL